MALTANNAVHFGSGRARRQKVNVCSMFAFGYRRDRSELESETDSFVCWNERATPKVGNWRDSCCHCLVLCRFSSASAQQNSYRENFGLALLVPLLSLSMFLLAPALAE